MKSILLKNEENLLFWPIFFAVFYVCCSIFANILSTKIVLIPYLNMEVDGGTIIYPLAFIARDMLHKNLGRKVAAKVVLLNALMIAFMAFLFFVGAKLPPASESWPYQAAFEHILLPVWRLVCASIIAEALANLLNGLIFSLIIRINIKLDMLASFFSNIAAMLVDSILFGFIAFIGSLPLDVVLNIILINTLVKGFIAIVGTPLIRLVKINTDHHKL